MSETTYTVRNAWGTPLFPTTNADEAERYARSECIVTAVTESVQ